MKRLHKNFDMHVIVGKSHGIALHRSYLMLFAEQECHLTTAQVDVLRLDQKPGYQIKHKGADSCDDTLKLTFEQCEQARLALDWKAAAVVKTNETSLPTGCYRQQEKEYRFGHNESSYVWYFNNAVNGQSDWKSESVCKGKAQRVVYLHVAGHIGSRFMLALF